MAEKKTAAKTTRTTKTAAKTTAARPRATAVKTAAKTTARKAPVRRVSASVPSVPAAAAAAGAKPRTRRRTKVGMVVSARQPHSVVVTIERLREHPLYKKVIKVRKRFAAHDAAGDVREGDLVRIQESRPFSRTKRWQVIEVLSRAGEAGAAAPRVAEVELALETAEGVRELLERPEREDVTSEEGPGPDERVPQRSEAAPPGEPGMSRGERDK